MKLNFFYKVVREVETWNFFINKNLALNVGFVTRHYRKLFVLSPGMTLSTVVTLTTICDFVSLKIISFVPVLRAFNKLLPNIVFFDLLTASEQENNLHIVAKVTPG